MKLFCYSFSIFYIHLKWRFLCFVVALLLIILSASFFFTNVDVIHTFFDGTSKKETLGFFIFPVFWFSYFAIPVFILNQLEKVTTISAPVAISLGYSRFQYAFCTLINLFIFTFIYQLPLFLCFFLLRNGSLRLFMLAFLLGLWTTFYISLLYMILNAFFSSIISTLLLICYLVITCKVYTIFNPINSMMLLRSSTMITTVLLCTSLLLFMFCFIAFWLTKDILGGTGKNE